MRGPIAPLATRSPALSGTRENLRIVSAGPRSERGGTIAWTLEPFGSRASAQGDDSSTRRPKGPTMRSIRCKTASSPSNRPSGALSMRPPRSTYTSSGPLTMTSVTSGSCSRNSIGPNPTTSSETSFTMRVSSRCGRIAPLARSSASASSRTTHPALGAGRRREPPGVDALPQLLAQLPPDHGERVGDHAASPLPARGRRASRTRARRAPAAAPGGSDPARAARRGRTARRRAARRRTLARRHPG